MQAAIRCVQKGAEAVSISFAPDAVDSTRSSLIAHAYLLEDKEARAPRKKREKGQEQREPTKVSILARFPLFTFQFLI
jgi:hypothetical protein